KKAGYHRYEISNYAKEGKESFHNKVYWQRGNYLGLGIGSASLIENVRFHNVTDISSYVNLMLGKNEQSDVSREQVEKHTAEKEQVEKVNEKIEYVRKGNIEKDCVEESSTEKNIMESGNAACSDTNIAERLKRLREEVQELPVEEQMEEFMFLGLRMMEGVSERKFYENFGRRFEEVFPGVIEKHEKLGLLEVTGEEEGKMREESGSMEKCQENQQGKPFVRLRLTSHGIDVSNQVFVDFML
ncbi:MAG: hypothetical protein Q4E29_12780, partial [Lachnospiraceae bacterium]|nr:hypothetical protein [Lachnospiraceae bacterium]